MTRIAIDAMGGDFGVEPIIKGVVEALKIKDFEAVLVGRTDEIQPLIPQDLKDRIQIIQADEIFSMSQSATDSIKQKNTSIFKSIELVRSGECNAIVSAGHSGATMSLAALRLGRLKNIIRPAIATLMPNSNGGKTLVLDVGANVDCKSEYLFQFAIMGEAYAKEIMQIRKPRVGLISNGEEDNKGNEITKEAFKLISRLDTFIGNVEGNQIFDGTVDVVVCDGFIGNILLKTSEGVASAIGKIIKDNVKQSFTAMIGAFMMKKVFGILKSRTDYDEYGGAPLLGVKNCVIISHGKSSPKAIKNAIFQALRFSNSDINSVIEDEVACFSR